MPTSASSIVTKQLDIFGVITRAVTNLKKLEIKKRTPTQVQTRIDILDANWNKFLANHDQLSQLTPDERKEVSYFQDEAYDQCEDAYIDARSHMLTFLDELRSQAGPLPGVQSGAGTNAPSARQLPRINLPHFSGVYRDWTQFRDLFTSMVGLSKDISDVEKMQYLKMSLTGEAAQLIKNISVAGENFERAWKTLVDRYENKRVLIDTHLAALFAIRQVTQQSASELKTLLGDMKEALGTLTALGSPVEHWDHLLVYMITRKLDSDSLTDWEKQLGAQHEPPSFKDLETFLQGRIRALEAVDRAIGQRKLRQNISAGNKPTANVKAHQSTTNVPTDVSGSSATKIIKSPCVLCAGQHLLSSCPTYRNKTPEQRREIVNQKGLCFNCLGSHHFRNCRSTGRCRVCGNSHHTSTHIPTSVADSASDTSTAAKSYPVSTLPAEIVPRSKPYSSVPPRHDSVQSTSASSNVALSNPMKHTPVLLATALVRVTSCYGEQIEVRALLDQGSEVSFITETLARQLNVPRRRVSLPIHGIGAQQSSISRGVVTLNLSSRVKSGFSLPVNAYVLAKLTSYLPPIQVIETSWPHLHGIELADPGFSSPREIDLVLGAEVYSLILEEGLRKGSPGSPVAQQTAFGWILSGSSSTRSENELDNRSAHGLQCSVDHDLLNLLQRFWLQEETPASSTPSLSEDDLQCEQHFIDTHSRTPEGRYVVRLPFKQRPDTFGDSRRSAARMLLRQEHRFAHDPTLKMAYTKFLAEYEHLGHMSLVTSSDQDPQRVFYLPHHPVVRSSSSTTKIRVVFNGSYRTNLNLSINDTLHVGPKLQTDLADVITRWRRHTYVFSADIEKMYRQIRVHQDDWDFQRVLWRTNSVGLPQPYHLCTVTYGLASAPYLAIRSLQQLSIDEEPRFPLAADIIRREVYVDDVLSGADAIDEAKEKIRQINECMEAGCFTLQKWTANDEQLLSDIPHERRDLSAPLSIDNDPLFRALGILWQPRCDSFFFTVIRPARVDCSSRGSRENFYARTLDGPPRVGRHATKRIHDPLDDIHGGAPRSVADLSAAVAWASTIVTRSRAARLRRRLSSCTRRSDLPPHAL